MDQTRWVRKQRNIRTYTVFPLFGGERFSERTEETRPGITYSEGSRSIPLCKCISESQREEMIMMMCLQKVLKIDARRVGHFTVSIICLYLFDIWTINTISVRWHSSVTFVVLRSESVLPLYFLLGYLHPHVVYLTRTLSRYLIQVTFVVLRIYLTRTLSSILIKKHDHDLRSEYN